MSMLFIKNEKNEWWKLYKEKLLAFDYYGGLHNISQQELENFEILECSNWRELYQMKRWCPLEVNLKWPNVWISPEGLIYEGEAHENRAKDILEIIYGEFDVSWSGDRLEERGWVRATTSLMWNVRINSHYWNHKSLTQLQYDKLWDWCTYHNMCFPKNIEIKN